LNIFGEQIMLIVMATVRAQEAHADAVNEVMVKLAVTSRIEQGCSGYRVFRAQQDRALFTTFEQWVSADAAQQHLASAHVGDAFKAAGPLLAEPPQIRQYDEL
jgi:quinol monooxygenase YgiN